LADDLTRTRQVAAMPVGRRQAHLEIVAGSEPPRRIVIDRDTLVIGRSREADLVLDADGVSRKHARITRSGQHALNIVDLAAKNGTFLNGERIDVAALHHGDRIQIGPVVLCLVFSDADAALPPVVPVAPPAATAAASFDARESPAPALSAREWEVAQCVARGLTNAEIAKVLGVSRRTVATHLERIYERLDIHSRAALAHLVARGREPG
jgi:DNA-binding CsgD family transcriptional regulator